MTHFVISQTWLEEGSEHLAACLELVERFDAVLQAQPGFVSRRLV
jgi:hypothetical protein